MTKGGIIPDADVLLSKEIEKRRSRSAATRGLLVLAVFVVCLPSSLKASVTWNITFNDVVNSTGNGFDDATLGATRRATVLSVFDYLDTVVDGVGSADILINDSLTGGTGSLASAGPFFFTGPNGFENGFVYDHATTGTDPTASVDDATATFDFGYNWNSDTGSPAFNEFDLFSVALHEFTHAMGWLSLVSSTGTSNISGGDPGVYSVYNSFLERGDGTALFGAGGDFLGTAADLTSDDVYFDGPNATAANGGNPVQVHAPGTFAPGSSISHIDDSLTGVMNFSIAPGVERRAFADFEIGILQDIGWTIVPEVSGAPLLAVLFATMACAHRRRGRRASRG